MKFGFGLVGLLVVIGIIAFLWGPGGMHPADTARTGMEAQKQVRQLSGQGDSGMRVTDSAALEPQLKGNKIDSLLVKTVAQGGPMQQYFGLRVGDQIVEIGTRGMGLQKVSQFNDAGMAEASAYEAFQFQLPLVVIRDGQRVELPQTATPTTPGAAPQAQQPGSSLQRQLQNIGAQTGQQ